jgi:NAD(P)-dependent dehydrogenase (short-subunit alcohol dehydrogenase family)
MQLEKDQVAVITGGASGIGLGLAEGFGARGLRIVLADVEDEALRAARRDLEDRGASVATIRADVRQFDDVEAIANLATRQFGRVDVVCNNAGVNTGRASAWGFAENDWRWVLDVNLWGVIHGIRAFAPLLLEQDSGHIVNVASMAALHPVAGLAPYAVSKHAVVALSECLRADLDERRSRVGVTVVCPLWVWSQVRNAERNRPPELGRGTSEPLQTRPEQSADDGEYMTPQEVADLIVEAVTSDQLYLLTHVSGREEAREHHERLLATINDAPIV